MIPQFSVGVGWMLPGGAAREAKVVEYGSLWTDWGFRYNAFLSIPNGHVHNPLSHVDSSRAQRSVSYTHRSHVLRRWDIGSRASLTRSRDRHALHIIWSLKLKISWGTGIKPPATTYSVLSLNTKCRPRISPTRCHPLEVHRLQDGVLERSDAFRIFTFIHLKYVS